MAHKPNNQFGTSKIPVKRLFCSTYTTRRGTTHAVARSNAGDGADVRHHRAGHVHGNGSSQFIAKSRGRDGDLSEHCEAGAFAAALAVPGTYE